MSFDQVSGPSYRPETGIPVIVDGKPKDYYLDEARRLRDAQETSSFMQKHNLSLAFGSFFLYENMCVLEGQTVPPEIVEEIKATKKSLDAITNDNRNGLEGLT